MRFITKVIAGLVFALACVGASSLESQVQSDGSVFIKLSPAEAASCAAEGGCAIVSQAGLRAMFKQYCGTTL